MARDGARRTPSPGLRVDELRLDAAIESAAETERSVRYFLLGTSDSPSEVACAWHAYRGAVNLRKSLEKWAEIRRWDREQARKTTDAAEA